MSLSMYDLSTVFHMYDVHMIAGSNANFESVTLLSDNQMRFEADILYICTFGHLNGINHHPRYTNLLLIGERFGSFNVSNFFDCNIAMLNSDISCQDVYNLVKKALNERKVFNEKYLEILSIPTMDFNYQQIANRLFKILNHPVAFSDVSFKTLGFTDCVDIDDYVWKKYTTQDYEPYEYLEVVKDAGLQSVFESDTPVLNTEPLKLPHRRLGCKISDGKNMLGWVTLIEYFQKFTQYDFKLLKLISQVLLVEMKKDSNYNYSRGKLFESIIIDLLNGIIKKPYILQKRLEPLDIKLKEYKFVLVINLKTKYRHSLILTRKELERIFYDAQTLIYGDNLVVLLSKKTKKPFSDNEKRLFSEYIDSNHLLCGISQDFRNLMNIRQYYNQAVKAVEIAIKLNIAENVLHYDDFMNYHMIDELQKNSELNNFFCPHIKNLILYDKNYNTNFTHSLYIYLTNNSDYAKAAQVLNIHRNTMAYRVKKVKEILNIDLDNNYVIFKMLLTFEFLKYMYGENFWDHFASISI